MGYLDSEGLKKQIQFIKEFVRRHSAGFPLGYEYFTINPNIPQGSLPLFGGEYSRATYADLWAWVQEQSGYLKTEAEWQTLSTSNNGNVPFYSDGDGSSTFRVPSLRCWVKGADGTVVEVGSYLQAGVPNITGALTPNDTTSSSVDIDFTGTGAIRATNASRPSGATGTSQWTTWAGFNIDASRSSSVYGKSSTVQPESIVGMWLVKAYGTVEDTGTIDEQQYIDDRIATLPNTFLPLAGGTMSGKLQLNTASQDPDIGVLVRGNHQNNAFGISDSGITKGTAPSETRWLGLGFYGNAISSYQNRLGVVECELNSSNKSTVRLTAYQCNAASTTSSASISVSMASDGTVSTSAPTPPSGSNNTNIATTAFVNSYFLPKSGGTVTGTLVLSKTTDASGTANNSPALIVGDAATGAHIEIDGNEILCKSNGTTLSTLYLQDGNACTYLNTSAFAPNVTNKITCGASGRVWKQLFAATTTISTSDERKKQQITDIPDELLDAWEDIRYTIFKFNDSVEEKGENARFHNGVIAQQIKTVFEEHNLNPYKYGFFCYDEWDIHEDPKDDTSPVIKRENGYAIRYTEALVIEAAYQRRKNKQLEERISRLEEIISTLQNREN